MITRLVPGQRTTVLQLSAGTAAPMSRADDASSQKAEPVAPTSGYTATGKALDDPVLRENLTNTTLETVGGPPEELGRMAALTAYPGRWVSPRF